jgi:RHS repeat-associated protein
MVSGMAAWFLPDRMGSVRNVVDNTGVIIDTISYDGYGNVTNETGSTNGGYYKAFGYRYDIEIALYYLWARLYDPATGRWLSEDPIGIDAGDTNLYRYVRNNPTNFTDPEGLIRGQGKYRDCENVGWKEVLVIPTALFGSRAWVRPTLVKADFKQANEIYEQCCIAVWNLGLVKWSEQMTVRTLGPELCLTPSINLSGGGVRGGEGLVTKEEEELTKGQKRKDVVYAYYVSGFHEANLTTFGYAHTLDTWKSPPAPSFFLSDLALRRPTGIIFSHELGHILMNDRGFHPPPGYRGLGSAEPNLMTNDPKEARLLSESQCDRMRKNRLVKGVALHKKSAN